MNSKLFSPLKRGVFRPKTHRNVFSAKALPQIPIGELSALRRAAKLIQRDRLAAGKAMESGRQNAKRMRKREGRTCIEIRVRTIVTIGLSLRPIVALSDDYRAR